MKGEVRKVYAEDVDIINIAINEINIKKIYNNPHTNEHINYDIFIKSDESLDKLVKIVEDFIENDKKRQKNSRNR